MPPMRRSFAAAAACVSLALVACTPIAKKGAMDEQEAAGDVCSQLTRVETALATAAALKPTSTVGEAEAAGKDLRKALKGLKKAEGQLEASRLKAFKEQAKAYNKELAAVAKNKGLTLEAAATSLKPKAEAVVAAQKALKAGVNCEPAAAAGEAKAN